MKLRKRKSLSLLLAVLLLAGQTLSGLPAQALETEEGLVELYSAQSTELAALGVTAGYLHEPFSSTQSNYTLTLGPDEASVALTATAAETLQPPTLELFLDGSEEPYCTLTAGQPSKDVPVALDQTRTLMLRSTSYSNGLVREYTIQAHRTSAQFVWRAGTPEERAQGRVLPVTLTATPGLLLKDLSFRLGFDPAVLRLADAQGAEVSSSSKCITTAEDFTYRDRRTGYFDPSALASEADNAAGLLMVQYGGHQNALTMGKSYQVGDSGELLTVYFRMEGEIGPQSLSVRPGSGAPRTGLSCTDGSGLILQGSGLARVAGLPELVASYAVTLPEETLPGGRITAQPKKSVFTAGETLTLRAEPSQGYTFSAWDVGSTGLTASGAEVRIEVTQDLDLSGLSASFARTGGLPAAPGVETQTPYAGERVLRVGLSQSSDASQTWSNDGHADSNPSGPLSAAAVDENGLTRLEFHDDLNEMGQSVSSNPLRSDPGPLTVGMRQSFLTRNTLNNPAWVARDFILTGAEAGINLWFAADDSMQVTPAQFERLLASFAQATATVQSRCGMLYDRDGNGALDVLLYDVQDVYTSTQGKSGSYVAGLTSYAELYGNSGTRASVGNNRDVIHLDTYPAMGLNYARPDVSGLPATLAHEVQHLAVFSAQAEEKLTRSNRDIEAMQPPTWLNEGLSVAMEHTLFGPRRAQIATFNTSALIRDGYALTQWGGKLEDYALSYLFVEYLDAQAQAAGLTDWLSGFYTSYAAGQSDTLSEVIRRIPLFAEQDLDEVIACFYAALYLQQDTGVYGFQGSDEFQGVFPQTADAPPDALDPSAAVYTRSATANASEHTMQIGLTAPELTLEVAAETGGQVTLSPQKPSYARGESVKLTAVPQPGYLFTGWSGESGLSDPASATVWVTVAKALTLRAGFERDSSSVEPSEPGPELGLMELDQASLPGSRYLVSGPVEARKYGFQTGVYDYALYLLPGETGRLLLRSEKDVQTLTVSGAAQATLTQGADRFWRTEKGANLPLTLAEGVESGVLTLVLQGAAGSTQYRITLHRVTQRPTVELSVQTEADGGCLTAQLLNAQASSVSIALQLESSSGIQADAVRKLVEDSLAEDPDNNAICAKVEITTTGVLRISIYAETGYLQRFQIKLFPGVTVSDELVSDGIYNAIQDLRFGTLNNTSMIAGRVLLTGSILAYRADLHPLVTLTPEQGKSVTAAISITEDGWGRQSFAFTAALEPGKLYRLSVAKSRHTGVVISGVTLTQDTALAQPLILYAGDFDEDGTVSVFDLDLLNAALGTDTLDLDGDKLATIFDLDILTAPDNYGGSALSLAWSEEMRGVN